MKIQKVKLNNFGPHEDLDVDFHPGFVCILGENGSGKSELISSIAGAISGDFHKKPKSRIINHGKKNGSVLVEGVFADKTPFSIHRYLRDTSPTTGTIGGKLIEDITTLNEAIYGHLQCDKSFLKNMVFVPQSDILDLLFGRASERNRLIQKFFGLEKAEKIDTVISSWSSGVSYPAAIDKNLVEEELKITRETLNGHRKNLENDTKELIEVREYLANNAIHEAKIRKMYETAVSVERSRAKIDDITVKLEMAKKKLSSLHDPGVSEDELSDLEKRISSETEIIKTNNELLSNLTDISSGEDGSQCFVCGSTIKQENIKALRDLSEKTKKIVDSARKRRIALRSEFDAKEELFRRYRDGKSYLMSQISSMEESLQALLGSSPEKSNNLRPSAEYLQALDEIQSYKNKENELEGSIKKAQAWIKGLESALERHEKSLEESIKIGKEIDKIKAHKQKISRVQNLFRYNGNATETYVRIQMGKMCECINLYLNEFSASYRVTMGKDNEFYCVFNNGKTISSQDLSNGEKVVLSFCFKFAAMELFTSSVGLLILDEPTTWLDDKRVEGFGEAIECLKKISAHRDLQVLVVTHERTLIPHFDQIIEL